MKLLSPIVLLLTLNFACKETKKNNTQDIKTEMTTKTKNQLNKVNFEKTIDGKTTAFYTLTNANGVEATFTNYGQRLISLHVPDKNGVFADVVLGPDNLDDYLNGGGTFGAMIGRYGNRIAKGKFTLKGENYTLAINNGKNHLHGGNKGYNNVVWDAAKVTKNSITFTRLSPDMEEGYPGNLMVKVTYNLTDDNALEIIYSATTDKTTVVNLTHHSYFNLAGEGNQSILNHELMINADSITPVVDGLIPTGKLMNILETPFDFSTSKPIGKDIDADNNQLKLGGGYDHNYVLNSSPKNENNLVFAAKAKDPISGRTMEVYTNEPGIQLYTGNFMDGTFVGKSGKTYPARSGFCLETQHYPDSPNQPHFPSTVLEPGEVYSSKCTYKFGAE